MNLANDGSEAEIEELRRKVRETTEKELIREGLRARSFSGAETLCQSMNLIDFALKVENMMYQS